METEVRPKRVCSPKYAIQKARKGKTLNRWEIEEIAKIPEMSFKYALTTKKRFPEGEAGIFQDPLVALDYSRRVMGGQWPEAADSFAALLETCSSREKIIREYFVSNGIRHAEVERIILQRSTQFVSEYAEHCVKDRWPEGEKVLLEDESVEQATRYHQKLVAGRWPELEDRILFGKHGCRWMRPSKEFTRYLTKVGQRIPDIEDKLERCPRSSMILAYAVSAVGGKLPRVLHQKMMMLSFDDKKKKFTKTYLGFLDRVEGKTVSYLRSLDDEELRGVIAKARTN